MPAWANMQHPQQHSSQQSHIRVKGYTANHDDSNDNYLNLGSSLEHPAVNSSSDTASHSPSEHCVPQSPAQEWIPQSPSRDWFCQSPPEGFGPQSPSENWMLQSPSQGWVPESPSEYCASHSFSQDSMFQSPSQDWTPQSPSQDWVPQSPSQEWVPQSPSEGPVERGLFLTRQQIKEHNEKVGWQQWVTLKGNVYHTTGFRNHFIAYNKKKAAEEAAKKKGNATGFSSLMPTQLGDATHGADGTLIQNTDPFVQDGLKERTLSHGHNRRSIDNNNSTDDDDDRSFDRDDDDYSDGDSDSDDSSSAENFLWQYDVIGALRKSGLCMNEIEIEIAPFRIGTLNRMPVPMWKYWESIRGDVTALLDDITSKSSYEVSKYEREYGVLLQQWLRKYSYMDPQCRHIEGDGNAKLFFLMRDPDTLRDWMRTLTPVDTEVPESGAWVSHQEAVLSPLPDIHDVFSASLRSHNSDHKDFCHHIHGEVAWTQLPCNVISDDIMTPNQYAVHERRVKLGDRLWDPERVKRRRQHLTHYFAQKYHYGVEKMARFSQWGALMDHNEEELGDLCQDPADHPFSTNTSQPQEESEY